MKDFFENQKLGLYVDDLRRFARILSNDLELVLGDYDLVIRLFDDPESKKDLAESVRSAVDQNRVWVDPKSHVIHLPVVYRKKALALVMATPSQKQKLVPEVIELLPSLVRLSLDKMLLYKINITDRETGLNNEYFFRSFLRRQVESQPRAPSGSGALRPLKMGEDHSVITVLLAEFRDFDRLAVTHGHLEAVRLLVRLANQCRKMFSGIGCLARLDRGRLGLVLMGQDPESVATVARDLVDQVEKKPQLDLGRATIAFGLASYPADLADELSSGEQDSAREGLVEMVTVKARLALTQALTSKGEPVLMFRDVLTRGGRVIQVLPYNRVVVNLGRVVGAREGQVFVVTRPSGTGQVDFKGEIALFEVHQDFALGEIMGLSTSTARVDAGDQLTLSRTSLDEPSGDSGESETLDRLLGIWDHQGFMNRLWDLLAQAEAPDRFAIIIARTDGYDRHRTTMGHLESDRQFKKLYEMLVQTLPEDGMVGRFSAESLVFFCPGLGEDEGRALAESWRDLVRSRHRRTATFGVAIFPRGSFVPTEIPANAQKALEHATFFGPASVAVFDSVSLNISGDKRFDAGDLEGAIDEYLKGLELNPADLNLLNSLGVCYGYQKQVDLALDTFDRVLELDPKNMMALYNRGFALALNGLIEDALASFMQALNLDPDRFDVLFQAGKIALELDRVDEAVRFLGLAARSEDRSPIVFRYLGQALLEAGAPEDALEAFTAAARIDPEDASSLSQLGVLFLERNTDLDVALSLIRTSVELDPSNVLFRRRLGRVYQAMGRFKEAERELHQVLDLGDNSREVFFDLGQVSLKLDKIHQARDYLKQALVLDPEYTPAAEALARITEDSPSR